MCAARGSHGNKPQYTVAGARAAQLPGAPQHVQMGDRLTHREGCLVQIEPAFEQDFEQIGRRAGTLPAGVHRDGQPLLVMCPQLFNARMQAMERFAV